MLSLFTLAALLLAAWLFGVWEREGRAAFMRDWLHVPFVAGVLVLLMALGLLVR
jgi:hypothetical protein